MPKKDKASSKPALEIKNKKAGRDYFIGETFEAGIELRGTEIKSLRAGLAQINDAFVRVDNTEAFMYQSHISEYDFGNINNHEPTRPRKLLLHKREILKLKSATDSGGVAIIPLKIYMKKSVAKVLIAICTGKKLYDKRDDLKKAVAMREAARALSNFKRR